MDEKFRVVLTGGGSGGHIYPLLAVAEELQSRSTEMRFSLSMKYLGPKDGFSPLFANYNIATEAMFAAKIRRYFSVENIIDVPKFFLGLIQAFWKLFFIMPDVIFSKGGTGALPVVIAGWFYRIPIAIHESDAQPGLTNSASARFAKKIFVSFERAMEKFDAKKVEVVGTPIRKELMRNRMAQDLAKENLGFSSSHPLILVLGGSQGSLRINNFILENLPEIVTEAQVLHQTGVANFLETQKLSRAALIDTPAERNRYEPVNYFTDNYPIALAAADIVIARAGSGTIFEIASFGKPAILIPLAESANDHQRANAYEFAKTGAAIVIEEANLLPGILLSQLKTILSKPETLKAMGEASTKFFIPDSAADIAEGLMKLGA